MATHKFNALSENGWINGEAVNKYTCGVSQYPQSTGIDIFRKPGCLSSGYSVSSIGGATVTDLIKDMVVTYGYLDSTLTRHVIGYGDAGRLYGITISSNTPSLIATITNPAVGLCAHKDYVYYARTTTIGRYGTLNATTPTTDNTYLTGLTATLKSVNVPHPMDSWGGYLYAGDVNLLKRVLGSESTGTTGSTILTLDADEAITCITHDQTQLIFATVSDPGLFAGSSAINSKATLYTWNGVDRNPTSSFSFPEPIITAIKVIGSDVLVFGNKTVYSFDGTNFKQLFTLGASVAQGGVSTSRRGFAWKDNNCIRVYGSNSSLLPKVLYTPFTGTGTTLGAVAMVADEKFYVGDSTNLYSISSGNAQATWTSKFIHLGKDESVEEVRVYTDGAMESGDDYDINIVDQAGTSYELCSHDYATLSNVSYGIYGATQFVSPPPILNGFQLSIDLNSNSAGRIREVVVITTPVSQP